MTDWVPDERPVPPELEPDYQAEPYADPWNSIMERIAHADPDVMKKLTNWGIGEPDAS